MPRANNFDRGINTIRHLCSIIICCWLPNLDNTNELGTENYNTVITAKYKKSN